MECYICYKKVPHYEYTRHLGSHPPPDVMSGHLQRDDINYGYDEDSDDDSGYSYEEDDYRDTTFTVPTVPHIPFAASSRAAVTRSTPNAFQFWLQNFKLDFAEYTTIDGQKKRNSDSEAEEFMRSAEVLRDTSKGEIVKIVKEFKAFSNSERQSCLELVRKVPIFPGLVAYVYTHLVKCTRGWLPSWGVDWSDRVPDLKRLVERCNGDGDIDCILSCDMIKKRLLRFLHDAKVSPNKHKCNPALLNGIAMLDYDIRNLAAVAALCITGPQKEKILLQRDIQAERLVELFHNLLEVNVELEERYRRRFFSALVMFSRECGYCPRGIYLAEDSVNGLVIQSQGGFGEVFKGRIGSINPRLVAVKVLKRGKVDWSEYKKELSKEAIVWRHLCHPNCLPLYGVYCIPTAGYINVALVSPWMNRGTLANYLKQDSKANRTTLILDVVRGLNYLHSMEPHVAHRDIKPANILITMKGRACLADFGLVSVFDTDEHFRTATNQLVIGGTPPYMAPEMFRALKDEDAKRKMNKRACDMYALGCTIYVVYTDKSPGQIHDDLMSDQLPVKISADMWSFVHNLCGKDPSKRLTAEMAVSWMEEKARQEGTDASPAPFEEEWEWRGPSDDKCLWSIY